MAISTDFSVSSTGDIRHVSGTTVYSVLDLHAWLQDLADNASTAGDDDLSILSSNPSKLDGPRDAAVASRLNLLPAFNIDADAAKYLNFGSIKQDSANVLYSGLKTIGGIVSGSPMYVVQNGSKLTKFWSDGHIQIMVLAKTAGALIDSGLVRVYSRKWGQTYSDFEVDLSAGGENAAALATAVDSNITLSEVQAAALSTNVTITVGDTTQDLGNGNGGKLYKGTIALSGGCTVQEAYQYCQYLTREGSTATVASVPGWRYRTLNAAYTPNAAAPFGAFAGGKWFVAQGWYVTGVLPSESQSYQLTAHDGTTQSPPNVIGITIGNLLSGDRILVARDNGSGGILSNELTLDGAHSSGASSVTVAETVTADHPSSGIIRVNGKRYAYSSWSGKTFALTGTLAESHSSGEPVFVPYIDTVTGGTSESVTFVYYAGFTARVKVRRGGGVDPIVPFETTVSVGSSGASTNAVRTSDV